MQKAVLKKTSPHQQIVKDGPKSHSDHAQRELSQGRAA